MSTSDKGLPTVMVVDADPRAIEIIRDRYSESYQLLFAQSVGFACEQMATTGDVDVVVVTINNRNGQHASLLRLSRCAGLRPDVLLRTNQKARPQPTKAKGGQEHRIVYGN